MTMNSQKDSPDKYQPNRMADREYLHAKIYALRPALLKQSNYQKMAESGQVHHFFPKLHPDALKKNPFAVKETIFNAEIDIIRRFLRISPYYRSLFIDFLRLFEIRNLKQVLARAFNKPYLFEQWYDIRPYQQFDRELLQQTLSPKDIQALLRNTYLAEAADNDDSFRKFETAESSIDICFLFSLVHNAADLSTGQRRQFLTLVYTRLEVMKKIWTCRLVQNYNWPPIKIKSHFEWLNAINTAIDGCVPGFSAFARSPAKWLRPCKLSEKTSAADLELALEKSFYTYIRKRFKSDFFGVDCVVCYLWLRYCQIQNLFSIVEGLYYRAPPGAMINRLIC